MAKIDPEQERQRLAEFYAGQYDGELKKVASQAYDLTEIAKEVLRAEIAKRGLKVNFVEQAPVPVPKPTKPPEAGDPPKDESLVFSHAERDASPGNLGEPDELVKIRVYRDLPQALLAKGSLESAGIECILVDDNLVRLDWFYSYAIGGIKLLVNATDAAEAIQVLNQPIPEQMDVDGVGQYEQPTCPKCGSLDVNFRELDPATYLSLGGSLWGVFIPIPIHRRAWSCRSCDSEWEDDGAPAPSESAT